MVTAVLLEVCGHHRRDLGHQRHRVRLGDEEGEIVHHMFFFQIRVESLCSYLSICHNHIIIFDFYKPYILSFSKIESCETP